MIEQFQHKLTTSFFLWFDNFLLTKGEAYTNTTGQFFYYDDPHLDSRYTAFGSPYKQWVNDSSVTGATIPTGVYVGGNISGRADGAVLDFDNGRALMSGTPTGSTITGSFSVKDFNLYMTNDTEEDLIVENKYMVNSVLPSAPYTYIPPYDDVVPAVFLSVANTQNDPLAFGGMQDTKVGAKAVILTQDTYQLDGVLSIFADSVNETFNAIPMTGYPTTELGDLKNNSYSYSNLASQYAGDTTFFIDTATTSKLTDRVRKSLANDMYVGFIDFDIQQHRYRFS
tara:strand:- start:551 stop:1399 length:849 start_codon:yes stop_codon:yes gene_type:complete